MKPEFKRKLLKVIAFSLFHLRILKVLNRFANRFQPRTNGEGKITFPFLRTRRARNVQILTYHRVNNDHDPFFPAVPVAVFEKQMEYLAANFNLCSLEAAVERMKKKDVPDNAVVVTFDDGYRDNYLSAFPILKKYAIPATIFLATDVIESGRMLWHDRVFSALRETKEPFLKDYGQNSNKYFLRTVEEKLLAQKEILKLLRLLSDVDRFSQIDRLIEKLNVPHVREAPGLMLNWSEVRTMHRAGLSFGSHTVTHPILSKLSNERIREEIQQSKQTIEEKIGAPVATFAYPNGMRGDFNETTKSILKETGYICALTTIFGTNKNEQDPFELRRGQPWEEYLPGFALKMNWYEFCSQSE